jgi:hypothetical protein
MPPGVPDRIKMHAAETGTKPNSSTRLEAVAEDHDFANLPLDGAHVDVAVDAALQGAVIRFSALEWSNSRETAVRSINASAFLDDGAESEFGAEDDVLRLLELDGTDISRCAKAARKETLVVH